MASSDQSPHCCGGRVCFHLFCSVRFQIPDSRYIFSSFWSPHMTTYTISHLLSCVCLLMVIVSPIMAHHGSRSSSISFKARKLYKTNFNPTHPSLALRGGSIAPYSMTPRSTFRTPSGSLTSLSKILLITTASFSMQAISPPFTSLFTRSTPAILRRPASNYYRLLTSGFLHGSVSHILVNTYSLTQIGPEVGEKEGGDAWRMQRGCSETSHSVLSSKSNSLSPPIPQSPASTPVVSLPSTSPP